MYQDEVDDGEYGRPKAAVDGDDDAAIEERTGSIIKRCWSYTRTKNEGRRKRTCSTSECHSA